MPGRRASGLGLTITDRELSTRGEFRGGSASPSRSPTQTYYAEDYQQYLAKHVNGFRCHANTGIRFPETA